MTFFDIIYDDLIVKILDIRCNDIENVLTTLENDMSYLLFEFGFLTIELKTTDELEKYDQDGYNYNDKYNIKYGSFIYCADIFLFKTIYYGKVIFVSYIFEDYSNDPDDFVVVQSKLFINPTMFQLVLFNAISDKLESFYPFIEGFNILSENACNLYNILPEYGVVYIETIDSS